MPSNVDSCTNRNLLSSVRRKELMTNLSKVTKGLYAIGQYDHNNVLHFREYNQLTRQHETVNPQDAIQILDGNEIVAFIRKQREIDNIGGTFKVFHTTPTNRSIEYRSINNRKGKPIFYTVH